MTDIYSKVAQDAAKFIWQGISSILPHAAAWFAADTVGEAADWVTRKKQDAPTKKAGFFSRLNPLNAIKKLNPASAVSFAARPFLSIKKAVSWFLFEVLAHEMKDKTDAISQKLAPIAENFLTPIVEKVTTPAINYLQNNGLMQLPKPDIKCPPVNICKTIPMPDFETLKEVGKQSLTTEQTGSFLSEVWEKAKKPLFNLYGSSIPVAEKIPVQQAFDAFADSEPVVEAAQTFAQQAAETVVPRQIPEGYLGLTEKYAEPAGRYVADTLSTAYNGVTKLVQKPADLTHAVQESTTVFAEALGVRPAYVYAAGAGLSLLAGYGLYSAIHGWSNKNTAVANATAQATGGHAQGNQLNLVVNVQGASPQSPLASSVTEPLSSNIPKLGMQ